MGRTAKFSLQISKITIKFYNAFIYNDFNLMMTHYFVRLKSRGFWRVEPPSAGGVKPAAGAEIFEVKVL